MSTWRTPLWGEKGGKPPAERGGGGEGGSPPAPAPTGAGRIKYVELYGSFTSLAANLSTKVIDYTIPDGHAAELVAVGVMPDYDPTGPASNLLDTEIGFDDKLTGIKFLTNHIGRNALPYGDRASKQPIRLLDIPMKMGNLTPKFNEGMKLQVVATAGATAISKAVRARALVLLYEEGDAMAVFGVGISAFATLTGGVSQALPQILFTDYAVLAAATAGAGKWEDLYTKSVKDFEQVKLSHVGFSPHVNADELEIRDLRLKREFPEYEPFWKVNEVYNALPFGDDDDHQPTQRLPSVVADHVFTNTTIEVKVKDLAAVIPAGGVAAQLLGTYRRVR